jgi:hypothetical protein
LGRTATATLVTVLALVAAAPASAGLARGKAYAPPNGKAYHGVSDTGEVRDFFRFAGQVRAHPALLQEFFHWDVPLTTGAFQRWARADTRGVLSLSTAPGGGREVISPRQIAKGRGDRYIINLGRTIEEARQTVYVRLMAEMNGHWNPYSAFNADGSRRGSDHATHWFRKAWRRFALIIRGGSRDEVNRKLVRMDLPRILRARSQSDPVYEGGADGIPLPVPERMPRPRVAMMWVPQSFGSPNVSGNQPADYWPGGRYVDWVGIDIYAKFRSAFDEGKAFFRRYSGKPCVIGEYGPWDNDFDGSFTRSLFDWAESHKRVKMLLYYRDVTATNAYNVQHYPGARRVLRKRLNGRGWLEFAPGAKRVPDPPPPGSRAVERLSPNPAANLPGG